MTFCISQQTEHCRGFLTIMNEWMNKQTNEWKNERMNKWMKELTKECYEQSWMLCYIITYYEWYELLWVLRTIMTMNIICYYKNFVTWLHELPSRVKCMSNENSVVGISTLSTKKGRWPLKFNSLIRFKITRL